MPFSRARRIRIVRHDAAITGLAKMIIAGIANKSFTSVKTQMQRPFSQTDGVGIGTAFLDCFRSRDNHDASTGSIFIFLQVIIIITLVVVVVQREGQSRNKHIFVWRTRWIFLKLHIPLQLLLRNGKIGIPCPILTVKLKNLVAKSQNDGIAVRARILLTRHNQLGMIGREVGAVLTGKGDIITTTHRAGGVDERVRFQKECHDGSRGVGQNVINADCDPLSTIGRAIDVQLRRRFHFGRWSTVVRIVGQTAFTPRVSILQTIHPNRCLHSVTDTHHIVRYPKSECGTRNAGRRSNARQIKL
mmetsp:Transcript_26458/g.39143  ORF Transcript_26458/g.39143 Transcript_26458/m.39143 type:complete len:302 (-) Transcript_26458:624-1529(-)